MALQLSNSQRSDGFSFWLRTSAIPVTRAPGVCVEVNSAFDLLLL